MFDCARLHLRLGLAMAAACVAALGACAHPISIAPDLSRVQGPATPRFAAKAGYHISEQERALEVTTPGGGGDKVRYYPYRELEAGLYMVLGGAFSSVTRVDAPVDAQTLRDKGVAWLVRPRITTNSSSESIFTWPPTSFAVELECTIAAPDGTEVARTRVTGFGNATFEEFVGDFGLAGKRASTDALIKLGEALGRIEALK